MSESSIENLEELLRALTRERGLRGRLRVLGRSWNLLRALSPPEREQVALRLGSKWAWKRLEKAFLRDGQLSETEQLVGDALQRMGESDPKELRKLARMVKEGDREGAQDLLMMTLTEALEEEADAEEAELAREPSPGETQPRPATATELVHTTDAVLASSVARRIQEPRPERPSPEPEPLRTRSRHADPRPDPMRSPLPEPSAQPELDLEPLSPEFQLRSGTETLQILRALQDSARPGAEIGPSGRTRLIDSLGSGWASRRALSRMITARSLDSLDEALRLIRGLARPGQQAWCLADLLEHWELQADDIERVLDTAPTDAARRRLAHRVGNSPVRS